MQERNSEKCVAIMVRATKFTAGTLRKSLAAYINHQKNKTPNVHHGKQKVKQLVKSGQKLDNIAITDANIKSFDRTARKYGIDYALKKDSSEDPPKYYIFFKAKDEKVMNAAFSEYVKSQMNRDKKPSIKTRLKSLIEQTRAKFQERTREKSKSREAEL